MLRWPENMTCVVLGKNEGHANSHGKQVGRHVLREIVTRGLWSFIPRAVSGWRLAWERGLALGNVCARLGEAR